MQLLVVVATVSSHREASSSTSLTFSRPSLSLSLSRSLALSRSSTHTRRAHTFHLSFDHRARLEIVLQRPTRTLHFNAPLPVLPRHWRCVGSWCGARGRLQRECLCVRVGTVFRYLRARLSVFLTPRLRHARAYSAPHRSIHALLSFRRASCRPSFLLLLLIRALQAGLTAV